MAGTNIVLQPRDRKLLAALEVLSCIDREIAQIIGPFASVTRANARLLQLTRAGILRRTFYGTINGGRRAVYLRRGRRYPSLRAFPHELSVSAVLSRFASSPPFCGWQNPNNVGFGLIPDGLVLVRHHGQVCPVYVEVDCGTEPMSVIERKVEGYLELAVSREASPFRVALITKGERRLMSLRRTVASRTTKLFFLTTLEVFKRGGPWAPIWLRPDEDGRRPLF